MVAVALAISFLPCSPPAPRASVLLDAAWVDLSQVLAAADVIAVLRPTVVREVHESDPLVGLVGGSAAIRDATERARTVGGRPRLPIAMEANVVAGAKGRAAAGDTIVLVYPAEGVAAFVHQQYWTYARPVPSQHVLAFLKQVPNQRSYCAATALDEITVSRLGMMISRRHTVAWYAGYECFWPTDDNASGVAAMVSQFLRWDSLGPDARSDLIASSLRQWPPGPAIGARWAYDAVGKRRDWHGWLTKDLTSKLLGARAAEDDRVQGWALGAIAMATGQQRHRTRWLISALDAADARDGALTVIEGVAPDLGTPQLPPCAGVDTKVEILKAWWAEKGSKDPALGGTTPLPKE